MPPWGVYSCSAERTDSSPGPGAGKVPGASPTQSTQLRRGGPASTALSGPPSLKQSTVSSHQGCAGGSGWVDLPPRPTPLPRARERRVTGSNK